MTRDEQLHEIEISLVSAKKLREMGKAIERLQKTPDYKLVIEEGYFTKEASRLVHLSADPQQADDKSQMHIQHSIRAIGELSMYLRMKLIEAEMAEKAIEDAGIAIEEISAEDQEED